MAEDVAPEGIGTASSAETPVTLRVNLDGASPVGVLGAHDNLLLALEGQFPHVSVHARGTQVTLNGPAADTAHAERLLLEMLRAAKAGQQLSLAELRSVAGAGATTHGSIQPILTVRGRSIRPQTPGQARYVEAIEHNTIVFGIGPAGTGKTYLAMAKAVQALQRKEVERIILSRPAIEAGERLGFLPGTLSDKIDPYLRPLYDALKEMMDPELVPRLLDSGAIEVAPLAYMRGRTLNNSFVILDEAQNTSPEQMKMFLTRLGFGSKMVITGDVTQVDLPSGSSGLRLVSRILANIDDIYFHTLDSKDVVRHTLVASIIDAYTAFDELQRSGR